MIGDTPVGIGVGPGGIGVPLDTHLVQTVDVEVRVTVETVL